MKALAAAAAVVALAGSGAPPPSSLATVAPVSLLAADGSLAAAVVPGDRKHRCTTIVLWRPGAKPTSVDTGIGCHPAAFFEQVEELALGGSRVLWQETNGGNNLELIVKTATPARPKPVEVSYVGNGNGAGGDPSGDYTGGLHADGPLLVFASWARCDPYADSGGGYGPPCVKGRPDLYSGVLHRVVAGKSRILRKGNDMLFPVWVDGGRVLVRTGSRLTLLRASGATLRTFDAGPNVRGAVFQGANLVVLRAAALDVYDTATGEKTHSYPLPAGKRRLVDVQSGIAVLVSGGAVRLIRLASGRSAGFTPTGGGTIQAQLEPSGLFMSSKTGLSFVPMARVLARFGG